VQHKTASEPHITTNFTKKTQVHTYGKLMTTSRHFAISFVGVLQPRSTAIRCYMPVMLSNSFTEQYLFKKIRLNFLENGDHQHPLAISFIMHKCKVCKKVGDLRPIAASCTFRCLGIINMYETLHSKACQLLLPLQVRVGIPWDMKLLFAIHQLMQQQEKLNALLKFNIKNAFNTISCDVVSSLTPPKNVLFLLFCKTFPFSMESFAWI